MSLTNEEKWEQKFQQLVAFKEEFGHCTIPGKEKKYAPLRNWLKNQRRTYKAYQKDPGKGELHVSRIHKLETIGVSLDPYSTNWNSRFQELVLFQRQHGHCRVPKTKNKSYSRLGQWLGRQKKDLRPVSEMERGILPFTTRDIERGRLLESVGVRLGE